ncbi:MAG: RDD family protein [Bryobacterales bacterium]|nr:RDD family protein [Bryobacterales bacterium]
MSHPVQEPHQQDLFRVIPFDAITPPRPRPGQAPRRPPPRRNAGRQVDPDQGRLAFADPVVRPGCPAPQCRGSVAPIASRVRAGSFDAAMVLAGVLLFVLLTLIWESSLPVEKGLLWAPISVVAVALCLYKLLFCALSDRSPGMRRAGLSLLHVTGRPAARRERLVRELVSLLSLLVGGIGHLWALVDEEHLAFHDHISETFPTAEPSAR